MTKISILYPNSEDARFDVGYYVDKHMPMAIELLSTHPGFKGVSVERGTNGGRPGTTPTYVAMCHFLFDSFENFVAAFTPHASALQGDIENYTNVEPTVQASEVLISR